MHATTTVALLCSLGSLSACGPAGSNIVPLTCFYMGQAYDHEEQFDAPGGCARFECDNGDPVAIEDDRIDVAGDLSFPSQEDVEANACLGTVAGNLTISGTAADLDPLVLLSRVGGTLAIEASDVVTLAGLSSLAEVSGAISIADNDALTSLGLPLNMSAFGDLTIRNNDALASLAGGEFIAQCGGCASVQRGDEFAPRPGQQRAPAGFGDEVGGGTFFSSIVIADNDVLVDLSALRNLYSVWKDFRLQGNAALQSLGGLNLWEVRGDLEVRDHAALPSADAETFAQVITVLGETTVCGNLEGASCP